MKHNEWENDGFDELLRDALASDAAPSGDFTERLMEQVRRTPQEKAKNRPYKKILAAVAACAVIAAAIPLVMPHGSIEAGADNAAPMMDMTADDGAYDNEYMTSGAPSGDREPADSQQKVTEDAKNGADDLPLIDADQGKITLVGQDADDAKAALDEMGIQPTAAENSSYTYDLTEQQALAERFNDVPLWIRPQSFFQTNPAVASQLYATARDWVRQLPVNHMWDLFCGVGGFGLHCATPEMQLTGIEIAPEAIACAKQSAAELALTRLQFQALDSTQFATAQGEVPELVLVNPPRRGIGKPLCDYLSTMAPHFIIYSSCNAQTMAKDIRELPGYRIERVQLFDMFPHTAHYEVLTLLVKQ